MAARGANRRLWLLWTVLTLAMFGVAGAIMAHGGPRNLLLIGKTTDAHHQIELACDACHTRAFGGREAIEAACRDCHQDELDRIDDSHPVAKFRDPRNADRLQRLDAMQCLSCHVEHNPGVTREMAVTLPEDFCSACHEDIGEERPTHRGLEFATCANAGCHNFHDNQALHEDFLEQHVGEAWLRQAPRLSVTAWRPPPGLTERLVRPARAPDAPPSIPLGAHVVGEWLGSAHAEAGVNCSGCHQPDGADPRNAASWIERPGLTQCATCHIAEAQGFTSGRHGMRLAEGMTIEWGGPFGLFRDRVLSPMRPELARLPMRADAHGRELTCNSCHGQHDFDVQRARVEACLSCHADEHSLAYRHSPHEALRRAELAGRATPGTGVTCATCHMPRHVTRRPNGVERLAVEHNQSANLRPNEKMVRSVCLDCHGLGFTFDALADRNLINRNFAGRPSARIQTLEWVETRMRRRGEP